jgi:hypothetical protein
MAARDIRLFAVADLDDGTTLIDVKRLPSEPPAELPQMLQERLAEEESEEQD